MSDKPDLNEYLAYKDVLIVEDEEEIRRLVSSILKKANFQRDPVEAANGQEALNKIRNQDFGLIISDIDMPKLKGTDLLKVVRALGAKKQCPIVFMSGHVNKEYLAQLVSLGVRHILAKPFNS